MSRTIPAATRVAALRTTMMLSGVLALGVLVEAALAGGFLGGHDMWAARTRKLFQDCGAHQ